MNNLFTNPSETVFEQGKALGQRMGDIAVTQTKTTAQAASSQVTGQSAQHSKGSSSELKMPVVHRPQETKDMVKDFYAPSKGNEILEEMKPEHKQAMHAQQQSKDQQDLLTTRQKMQAHLQQHMTTYYRPTFEDHPKIEEQKEEQEKRQEEAEEMKELEIKEKKKEDTALRRAQTSAETKHGAVG